MKAKTLGRLRHVNCPAWQPEDEEFPKFMAGRCVACNADIDNLDAIPTYEHDDGIFYSVEVNGHFIEVGREV